jgi:endogenous inhibitor of DNA gyrase (YacG/DUF329 family)
MAEITKLPRRRKPANCPLCGKPTEERYQPFCSKRCADIDLNRWLGGVYRVETNEAPEEGGSGGGRGPGGDGEEG